MLERDSISRIESGTRFVADYELYVFANVLGVDVASLLEVQEKPWNTDISIAAEEMKQISCNDEDMKKHW